MQPGILRNSSKSYFTYAPVTMRDAYVSRSVLTTNQHMRYPLTFSGQQDQNFPASWKTGAEAWKLHTGSKEGGASVRCPPDHAANGSTDARFYKHHRPPHHRHTPARCLAVLCDLEGLLAALVEALGRAIGLDCRGGLPVLRLLGRAHCRDGVRVLLVVVLDGLQHRLRARLCLQDTKARSEA